MPRPEPVVTIDGVRFDAEGVRFPPNFPPVAWAASFPLVLAAVLLFEACTHRHCWNATCREADDLLAELGW